MADAGFQHSEAFLQWIWENLLFDFSSLKTTNGKTIEILHPGELNRSDGPDFLRASIEIDGLTWYGDVEIHTRWKQWNAHGHQNDPKYNSVVLHVVTDENPQQITTANGSIPYTVNLLPHLSDKLHRFLQYFEVPTVLPCASSIQFISEKAFYAQIEKAHTEYFEKKADDFLRFYDPEMIPSKAWKYALILSIWDGLGISHNRKAMQKTAGLLLEQWDGKSIQQGNSLAMQIAGFENPDAQIIWNYKSVRPANHPKNRISEAVKLSHFIINEPFGNLLSLNAIEIWNEWMRAASLTNSSRMDILFGTVFLPSLYVLGNLFAYENLNKKVSEVWKNLKTPIPATLLKKFKSLDLNNSSYRKKLGAVHQLKSYCKPGKCTECLVLKKAIES